MIVVLDDVAVAAVVVVAVPAVALDVVMREGNVTDAAAAMTAALGAGRRIMMRGDDANTNGS